MMNPVKPSGNLEHQFPTHIHVQDISNSIHINLYAYRGMSMSPTLQEPDALEIVPYDGLSPRVGDVVVCMPPNHEDYVVHRISGISPVGILTRGDNSWSDDPWILDKSDIIGRVTFVWRGQRKTRLPGGLRGVIQQRIQRGKVRVMRRVAPLIIPLYTAMVKAGFLWRWMPGILAPQVVLYKTANHNQYRLLWQGKVIGRYLRDTETWRVQPPFRLLVDPALLRHPEQFGETSHKHD